MHPWRIPVAAAVTLADAVAMFYGWWWLVVPITVGGFYVLVTRKSKL